MAAALRAALLCVLLVPGAAGQRDSLAERKACADEECSHPISVAVTVADYIAPDCRFIHLQRGQVVYVFSKLRGRGKLFWSGSVQGDYYGEQPARLGYFPSSAVRETRSLRRAAVELDTDEWDFYCHRSRR
ncbi:melanoma-derived growth regulatory protein [Struthio camelus]|uniref:melanoma-derived growth regulatory protein n=1 Tax=Struthio camelus TaxID=8801 RepID=UPI003603DD6D